MANQATKQAETNEKGFVKKALNTAEKVVQTGLDVEELKEKASHAVEDGIVDAKRKMKKARYAAEDLVDDTAHYIKHDPWRSVGITFGVGFGMEAIAGLLLAREANRNCDK